jgi:hypothetical protein
MSNQKQDWTPAKLLEAWGMRQMGPITSAGPDKTTGGDAAPDAMAQAAHYVEQVPGFDSAREVLSHVYYAMKPTATFRVVRPGEVFAFPALIRGNRRWGFCVGMPERIVGQAVLNHFWDALADRLRVQPFVVIYDVEEETDWERDAAEKARESLRDLAKSA